GCPGRPRSLPAIDSAGPQPELLGHRAGARERARAEQPHRRRLDADPRLLLDLDRRAPASALCAAVLRLDDPGHDLAKEEVLLVVGDRQLRLDATEMERD